MAKITTFWPIDLLWHWWPRKESYGRIFFFKSVGEPNQFDYHMPLSDTISLNLRSYGGDKQEFMLKVQEYSLAIPKNSAD